MREGRCCELSPKTKHLQMLGCDILAYFVVFCVFIGFGEWCNANVALRIQLFYQYKHIRSKLKYRSYHSYDKIHCSVHIDPILEESFTLLADMDLSIIVDEQISAHL